MRARLSLQAVALCTALLPSAARPGEPAGAQPAPEGAPYEMESYQLVLLMRAPTWKKLPEAEAKALQAAHIAHLTKMGETGKAAVCGPFDNQQDVAFRGACIYTVKTPEEARALASADPTVKAGQLRVEVVTWWVGKGYMTFPKAQPAGR
jgi:uncharacterized protein YciI